MKRLTLLRHAKSGEDPAAARDFDRALNAKGRRAARAIGAHLKGEGFAFDHAVASPAVRVAETVEEAGRGFGAALDPAWDRRLYLAPAATLLDVVQETPDDCESLLVVAHNPGLEELVLALVPDRDEDLMRDLVEEKYPTASVAEMLFEGDSWTDVRAGRGRLARFIRPRDIDPALGPDPA